MYRNVPLTFIPQLVDDAEQRLRGVLIERMPWQKCLKRYDLPDTLFYQDPPYLGHEADYGEGVFSCDDYPRLAAMLRQIQGRFLLSMNDRPEVRQIFQGFPFIPLQTQYSFGSSSESKRKKRAELFYSLETELRATA